MAELCPRDQTELEPCTTSTGIARRCPRCQGELHTLAGLRKRVEPAFADAVVKGARGGVPSGRCPDCGKGLRGFVIDDVDVESCPDCRAVWLPFGGDRIPMPTVAPKPQSRFVGLPPEVRERMGERMLGSHETPAPPPPAPLALRPEGRRQARPVFAVWAGLGLIDVASGGSFRMGEGSTLGALLHPFGGRWLTFLFAAALLGLVFAELAERTDVQRAAGLLGGATLLGAAAFGLLGHAEAAFFGPGPAISALLWALVGLEPLRRVHPPRPAGAPAPGPREGVPLVALAAGHAFVVLVVSGVTVVPPVCAPAWLLPSGLGLFLGTRWRPSA